MDREKIQNVLMDKFNAPLKDYYKRHIIFWLDPDKEFTDLIDEIDIDGVKILKLNGKNNFIAKRTLVELDKESNYLVYKPYIEDSIEDNWFLDLELSYETFMADRKSMIMDDLSISDSPQMRRVISRYSTFFNNKERVGKLKSFYSDYEKKIDLIIDILAVLTDSKNNDLESIIISVLVDSLDIEENECLENIEKFGNIDDFWALVEKYTGYTYEGTSSLLDLIKHLSISSMLTKLKVYSIDELNLYISESRKFECYSIINSWMNSEFDEKLYSYLRKVENDLNLSNILSNISTEDIVEVDTFPLIDELILSFAIKDQNNNTLDGEKFRDIYKLRRRLKWYSIYEYYYEALLMFLNMNEFKNRYINGFSYAQYEKLWTDYNDELYKMDTYYRKFIDYFNKTKLSSTMSIQDDFIDLSDNVENLYKNWYLENLGSKWNTLIREDFHNDSRLFQLRQQEDFYQHYVSPIIDKGMKVFVIISDAFRYEVAKELFLDLKRETSADINIESIQGIFPTATKFGMAALLPHKELTLDENLNVLADGYSTKGLKAREKVLDKAMKGSVAIGFNDFQDMRISDLRDLTKDSKLVYIYHNAIDSAGDNSSSESEVFDACKRAIDEIKSAIKKISSSLGIKNVLVTADHGFIYTNKPLTELDKAESALVDGKILENNRRYYITSMDGGSEYINEVSINNLSKDLKGFTPNNYIRMRKQGGGERFVHGGSSLQEMVVPVIEYKSVRSGTKGYKETKVAGLQLVNKNNIISNNIYKVKFYQDMPIGDKVRAGNYQIYIADSKNNPISDIAEIITDRTSEETIDREINVKLTLKSNQFTNNGTYYLTIFDSDNNTIVERFEYRIEIAFYNDFDF